jgi:hypothetical protein
MRSQISIIRLSVFALLAALFACLFTRQFHTEMGHDQVSYLFEAQRFLSGAEPYGPHLSETNPPLIIWFSAIPVMLARVIPASPSALLRFFVLGLLLASTAWCISILRRSRSAVFANPIARVLFACAILFTGFSIGGYDFGQREHLLILLLLPYVLAVASGAAFNLPLAERCALGVAAGLSIWFKPHDTLVLIALELFIALRTSSLRRLRAPEFLAVVATGTAILALVLVVTPLYFKQIVPLLFDTYWALGTRTTLSLALTLRLYGAFVVAMLLVYLLVRKTLRNPTLFLALVISSIAASVAFDLQHTEWRYHRYPHLAFLLLALLYLLIDLSFPVLEKLVANPRILLRVQLAAIVVMCVPLFVAVVCPRLLFPTQSHNDLDRLLDPYPPSTTVTVFSTSVTVLNNAYLHNLNWGSRFAHLWMMPALLQNELGPTGPPAPFKRLSPETLARISALQRSQSAEDLNYWKPPVVLFERGNQAHPCQGIEGKTFSMLEWFLRGKDFADEFSHYEQKPSPSPTYDLYVRVR